MEVWKRKDGSEINIKDMTRKHIVNSIEMLKRENKDYNELESYNMLIAELEKRDIKVIENLGNDKLNKEFDVLYKRLNKLRKLDRTLHNIIEENLLEEYIRGFKRACNLIVKEK